MIGLIAGGIIRQVDASGRWMAWNVALALAPWFLSLVLFRPYRRPGAAWLCGALTCLLLVPNAAYILTDVVHLPADVRREPSDAVVLLVVLPMYATVFAIGLAAYSDVLRRLTRYATGRGWARSPWTVEVPVHLLSAVAIYIGRIHRLNSWDVARQPAAVLTQATAGFTRPLAVVGIATMFIALTLGQTLSRPLLQAGETTASKVATLLGRTRP
ncbi:MAG: hypothetical protein QOJ23_3659 [Actinomycetota bacterium]|jgi:uncharacterized membrane protein|nr:hypothetical protein [Actinomycetota bacterium]MDQ1501364.1 hypothetical protein [Actinomycetota bacterium]